MGTRTARGAIVGCLILASVGHAQTTAPADRVDALMGQLTVDEKITLLAGVEGFFTRPIERLGIPRLKMTDGPNGTRNFGKSTAYPAGMMLAATWDPALAQREGEQLGRDARSRGCHFLLAPGMNIYRHPRNGRNFEYFGEDPLLTGVIAAAYVRGVESQNVGTTIKHFAANNQETDRRAGNSIVDERTLREIYLPAYKRAIDDGKPAAVMSSYNRLNGDFASASPWLLTTILRDEWKYTGLMMSDWGAVHDTRGPIVAGLDLEMPGPKYLNKKAIEPMLASGEVTQAQIDSKVRRLLTLMVTRGWIDKEQTDESIPKDNADGARVALDVARAGMTLLKNDGGLLPLDRAKVKEIVVVGPLASETPVGGGGSGYTQPFKKVSFADGIRAAAGADVKVTVVECPSYESLRADMIAKPLVDGPFVGEFFDNPKLEGAPVATRTQPTIEYGGARPIAPGVPRRNFSARWKTTLTPKESRTYRFFTNSDDGSRVWVDGELVVNNWQDHKERLVSGDTFLEAGKKYEVVIEYYDAGGQTAMMQFGCGAPMLFDDASLAAVRRADAVVACVGYAADTERESYDRPYVLPAGQEELLQAVVAANAKTTVVITAGGGVDTTRWIDKSAGLVHAFYAGQAGGTALGEILFGDVNPSGRLPFTMERQLADVPSTGHWGNYGDVKYEEGVFVGYRGFDAKQIEPRFPFGFGLSYTTFVVENAKVARRSDDVVVSVDVANTGTRDGATVVQCYVAPPQIDVPRPPQELRAFAKVALKAGERKTVELTVPRGDLAFWNPATKAWTVTPGEYEFRVGADSRHAAARALAKVD